MLKNYYLENKIFIFKSQVIFAIRFSSHIKKNYTKMWQNISSIGFIYT